MANNVHTLKSVLRAHNSVVNGVTSMDPTLDDATSILHQAHGVLVVAAQAREDNTLNDHLVGAALEGAQTLLELGLRNLNEGHRSLLRRFAGAH